MRSVANEAAYQYISINISLSKFNLKLESPVAILVVLLIFQVRRQERTDSNRSQSRVRRDVFVRTDFEISEPIRTDRSTRGFKYNLPFGPKGAEIFHPRHPGQKSSAFSSLSNVVTSRARVHAATPPRRRRRGIRGSSACDPPSMVETRSSPRVGHMRASPSSARTPAQPVRRAACAHNASPQSPAARASLVARVGAGAASPARRRRALSKWRARAPLPPSASWYPFLRNAQCAYPGIGPHRSIGFLVGEPRRSVRILVKMYTGFSV